MDKVKTSGGPKKSSPKLSKHDPTKTLKNRKQVLKTLIRCLVEDDIESFQDVLVAYLKIRSKAEVMKETNLPRQTLYDLEKKPFNPTLATLGPILKSLAA